MKHMVQGKKMEETAKTGKLVLDMKHMVQIKKTLGEFKLDIEFKSSSNRIGILGASGSGKSMILKMLAGIECPEKGKIYIGEKLLFDDEQKINVTPQKRKIGYLFQNYALFPNMTVAENIGAGLKGGKIEKQSRVFEMMEKFQLTSLADRFPVQLSGGQQQRTALARLMAYQPDIILLDEPFSALDVFLKDQMQKELEELLQSYQGFVILVSHNRDEIYRFCEELLVIDQGHSIVYGRTQEIFAAPIYRQAAKLTGCKNIVDIRRVNDYKMAVPGWGLSISLKSEIPEYITCIGYRAHDFVPVWGERKANCLKVQVKSVSEMPFESHYYLFPEDGEEGEVICWFVQKEKHQQLTENGFPDYLQIREESLMLLQDNSVS